MSKKKFSSEKGFATSDALIAILIIALFTGIIATLVYNIYLANTAIKRMGRATEYITNIFEFIDKSYYDDINVNNIKNYINNENNSNYFNITNNQIKIYSNNNLESEQILGNTENQAYKIEIYIENYNKTNEEIEIDLVKKVTMKVEYKLGNKNQVVEMERVRTREKLEVANYPDLNLLTIPEGQYMYPIKYVNNRYVVCNENDINWYSYENNVSAKVGVTTQTLKPGDIFNIKENIAYEWIPRYAISSSNGDKKYLFSTSNKYLDTEENIYPVLKEITQEYLIDASFNNVTGKWKTYTL